ncbi:MAG: efflux RND transporter periplasmic adaptor subunit [Candidatus Riflebacteria bacterium]|nr:efflux RND transporter periplasmic adaptor subunit [Candidatus Riflebacteria bacterium]
MSRRPAAERDPLFHRGLALVLVCLGLTIWMPTPRPAQAADQATNAPAQTGSAKSPTPADSGAKTPVIEGALINPYQTANVGADVSGIIDRFHFNEGDLIQKGQVVVELSKGRYALQVKKAASDGEARREELEGLKTEEELKGKLLALSASTRMSMATAETRRKVAAARVRESVHEVEMARLNLALCEVKAPFTGHLAVRYKQPFEPAERLEKLFALVDSSKVYAVGNLPEDLLGSCRTGAEAVFVHSSGKRFVGKVERLAKLIDPQSRTKRVYVLLDNSGGELEVGMLGSIRLDGR